MVGLSVEQEEDAQYLQEISDRQELAETTNREINVSHPICYDAYDLCEHYHNNTFQEFNVALLKTICNHLEIPVKSRDRKKILIDRLSNMISECEKFNVFLTRTRSHETVVVKSRLQGTFP